MTGLSLSDQFISTPSTQAAGASIVQIDIEKSHGVIKSADDNWLTLYILARGAGHGKRGRCPPGAL